jgi:hypothetical protein
LPVFGFLGRPIISLAHIRWPNIQGFLMTHMAFVAIWGLIRSGPKSINIMNTNESIASCLSTDSTPSAVNGVSPFPQHEERVPGEKFPSIQNLNSPSASQTEPALTEARTSLLSVLQARAAITPHAFIVSSGLLSRAVPHVNAEGTGYWSIRPLNEVAAETGLPARAVTPDAGASEKDASPARLESNGHEALERRHEEKIINGNGHASSPTKNQNSKCEIPNGVSPSPQHQG